MAARHSHKREPSSGNKGRRPPRKPSICRCRGPFASKVLAALTENADGFVLHMAPLGKRRESVCGEDKPQLTACSSKPKGSPFGALWLRLSFDHWFLIFSLTEPPHAPHVWIMLAVNKARDLLSCKTSCALGSNPSQGLSAAPSSAKRGNKKWNSVCMRALERVRLWHLHARPLRSYEELESPESEVAQSCPTLCNLTGHNLPGSCVHGIFQARVVEWVTISFSRSDLPDPGIEPGSKALPADALPSEPPS